MKRIFALVCACLIPITAGATDTSLTEEPSFIQPVEDRGLDEFLWTKRVVVVFADSENDPRFREQLTFLRDNEEAMLERDVIVLTDTDRSTQSELRQQFRPRGFMLVLIGKDGTLILRKPFPWRARELAAAIDKTPLRQQEMDAPRE